jgi:hypothetical protein
MGNIPTNSIDLSLFQSLVAQGDELRKSGRLEEAIHCYLAAAKGMDPPRVASLKSSREIVERAWPE